MSVDGIEALIFALVKTTYHLPPHTWRRARYAVSKEEYEAIRDYLLKTEGKFVAAIRMVPLVIEEHPLTPAYCVEER